MIGNLLILSLSLVLVTPGLCKKVKATAYCLGPCRVCGTRGKTATGSKSNLGIAVSKRLSHRVFPLSSRKRYLIKGYGYAKVDDVGSGVRKGSVDIRFKTHREAKRFGFKVIEINE